MFRDSIFRIQTRFAAHVTFITCYLNWFRFSDENETCIT